nr:SDR family NAD(P)-dependent oxidoreductase [Bacillus wiedmannii]
MEERLAIIVESIQELEEKLKGYVEGQCDIEGLYRGQVKGNKETLSLFVADEELQEAIEKWIQRRKYSKLTELWVKGLTFDWKKIYSDVKTQRISLPTYPFAKQRYWVPEIKNGIRSAEVPSITGLQDLEILAPYTSNMRAMVKECDESMIDIELCDEQGNVCIRLKGLEVPNIRPLKLQESFEMMTFTEDWLEQALSVASTGEIKTLVCFLSNPENQQVVMQAVQSLNPYTKVLFISQDMALQEAFQSIQEEHQEVDGMLYLWPFEDVRCVQDVSYIVNILQSLSSSNLKIKRFLLSGQYESGLDRCYLESWIGFERSLGLVLPNIQVATVIQEAGEMMMHEWIQKLWGELQTHNPESALYQKGKRYICQTQSTNIESGSRTLKTGGTYLITGGCGGLGFLFAEHFARTRAVNLILTGRSQLDEEKISMIETLEKLGSQVMYVQADVCDATRMREGIEHAKKRFGEIHGVIHAAGLSGEQSILEKDIQEFQKVLAPKIEGSLVLNELLSEEKELDFICYFSSSSAILGDFGSCDYAIGNRFQMAYAQYRNKEQGPCKNFVINWPMWKEGGMGAEDDKNSAIYLKSSGQRFLETNEGLQMFDRILSQNDTQHLILVGQKSRVENFLGLNKTKSELPEATTTVIISTGKGRKVEMRGFTLEQCVEWDLKEQVSQILKISREDLDIEENLVDFGFDSISLAEFANMLSNYYGIEVTPSLFFGHFTLEKLTKYFLVEHKDIVEELYHEKIEEQVIKSSAPVGENLSTSQVSKITPKPQKSGKVVPSVSSGPSIHEPIAIIGMSGRFPQSNNVQELWQNIKSGKNCITQIPKERWDWQKDYKEAHIKSKWGGFISGIDQFDPLFFEISPKEAEYMDPRQRLFLEEAWHALEDAGYMGDRIRGTKCGVYVGVEEGEYGFLAGEAGSLNSNQNATLSARIAYALDLKGPNLALTAACSSGLVAIHQACQSLRQGDCEMALVGGVSLLISPMIYKGMSKIDMLSPDGHAYVFDRKANGLVPSEAVGVVLLKPLSKAIEDRDHIHACITASGVNYNGQSNGLTSPNPVAQTELVTSVYDRYNINPNNIQYVMSHSVGSKVGDSIEIQALSNAFNKYTNDKQFCTIGSVKPLIGHTFAASGMVNLISMIMAMKDRTIPALYGFESSNEYINFKESPFVVNTHNKEWDTINNRPRVGAISTTGISGTNAHAVIEEYIPIQEEKSESCSEVLPQLVVLSAKNQDRLLDTVQQLHDFLQREDAASIRLADLAYTLQVGREAMKKRVAFLVSSKEELLEALATYVSFPITEKPNSFLDRKQVNLMVEDALKDLNLEQLAEYWIAGNKIAWEKLHDCQSVRIISLPTYPFTKRRCWIQQEEINKAAEFYTHVVESGNQGFQEEYLTFCPFEEKIPGFSISRVYLNPDQFPDEVEMLRAKQIEMRQVLFSKVDFSSIQSLFDIGCGHGTDVIQIAKHYPHIRTHGFTITPAQVKLGNQRINELDLSSQAEIFYGDSSKDKLPGSYDAMIGIEVSCHIRDKQELFRNMAMSLNEGGTVLMMDFIANLRGPINDPNIGIYIPTVQDWIDLLSKNYLVINEVIDVSSQIANSLYDPEHEQNTNGLPQVVKNSIRNFANCSTSLEKGWTSYCLFVLRKDTSLSEAEIRKCNVEKMTNKVMYPEALQDMLYRGYMPYPLNKEKMRGVIAHEFPDKENQY